MTASSCVNGRPTSSRGFLDAASWACRSTIYGMRLRHVTEHKIRQKSLSVEIAQYFHLKLMWSTCIVIVIYRLFLSTCLRTLNGSCWLRLLTSDHSGWCFGKRLNLTIGVNVSFRKKHSWCALEEETLFAIIFFSFTDVLYHLHTVSLICPKHLCCMFMSGWKK